MLAGKKTEIGLTKKAMENERESLLYIIIPVLLIIPLYIWNSLYAVSFAVAFEAIYFAIKFEWGFMFWYCTSYFIYLTSTSFYAVSIGILIVSFFVKGIRNYRLVLVSDFLVFMFIIAVGCCSFVFGYDSQLIPMLLCICNILIYIVIIRRFNSLDYVQKMLDAFWIAAFLFIGITITSMIKNGIDLSGRLSFDDNVRNLSNAIVVPIYIWIISLLSQERYTSINKSMEYGLGIIGFIILLLTLSKGPIFGLALGVLTYCICSKKGWVKTLIILLLVILFGAWLQSAEVTSFARLTQRNFDLNGRTRIWGFYYQKLKLRGIKGILFGFGPGNVKRVAVGEYLGKYYVHSTILDFFFSYGIVGFSAIIVFLMKLLVDIYKAKEHMGIGLLIMLISSYFVSGASTNTQFFLCCALLKNLVYNETERKALKYI